MRVFTPLEIEGFYVILDGQLRRRSHCKVGSAYDQVTVESRPKTGTTYDTCPYSVSKQGGDVAVKPVILCDTQEGGGRDEIIIVIDIRYVAWSG